MVISSGDTTTPAIPEPGKSEDAQGKASAGSKRAGQHRLKRWRARLERRWAWLKRRWAWLLGICAAIAAIVAFLTNVGIVAGYSTSIIHRFRTVCLANTPINFDLPATNNPLQVGEHVDAYGTRQWAINERLWLVLYASNGSKEVYYPFSRLQLDGSSWVANRVTVGGHLSTDAEGSLYLLDLVRVNPSADKIINGFMAQKGPSTGMADLPKGAKVVKQVILSRVC